MFTKPVESHAMHISSQINCFITFRQFKGKTGNKHDFTAIDIEEINKFYQCKGGGKLCEFLRCVKLTVDAR